MTRTLIYGITALIVVIIAALIAFVFSGSPSSTEDIGQKPGFFESLFPFDFGTTQEPLFIGDTTEPVFDATEAPVLRKVSEDPVSGGFVFDRSGQTFIRFINRATGHVYETIATSTAVARITNTTVPGIQESLWFDADTFIVRYLNGDNIETFLARLSPNTEEEQRLDGVFLESHERAALDPQKENLLAVVSDSAGSSFILSEPDGSGAREVFKSPITSWVPLQSENGLFVYTAPLSGFVGNVYQISGGTLRKVTGNVLGLMAKISPSGRYVLISSGDVGTASLLFVDTETGDVYESPVNTLVDKCTFGSSETDVYCGVPDAFDSTAAYPNDWLLGRTSFSDTLWHIFFTTESGALVNDLGKTGEVIDVTNLTMNPGGTHLLFTNKNDLSLWSLQIREPGSAEEN